MKKKILAAAAACVMLFTAGCTQSNILKPEGRPQPDFSIVTDVKLDWEQISEDVASSFEGMEDEYPGLLTFNYAHKDEEKLITAQLFVDDTVDGEAAAAYAADLIRYINDAVSIQNNSLAFSTEDTYGGFFDDYSFQVQVMPDATQDDESTWLVNMRVEAGTNAPILPIGAESQEGEDQADSQEAEEAAAVRPTTYGPGAEIQAAEDDQAEDNQAEEGAAEAAAK